MTLMATDRNLAKQGDFLPSSRITVVKEQRLKDEQPHSLVLLPCSLKEELLSQLHYIRE